MSKKYSVDDAHQARNAILEDGRIKQTFMAGRGVDEQFWMLHGKLIQSMSLLGHLGSKMFRHNVWGMDQTGQIVLPGIGEQGPHSRVYPKLFNVEESHKVSFDWNTQQLQLHFPGLPNNSELHLFEYIKEVGRGHRWPWIGDQVSVGGRWKPDFVDHEGKTIVEMFGDYYHSRGEDSKRIALFESYGYRTLIVWEHMLIHGELVKKALREFACGTIQSGILT